MWPEFPEKKMRFHEMKKCYWESSDFNKKQKKNIAPAVGQIWKTPLISFGVSDFHSKTRNFVASFIIILKFAILS